MKIIDANNFDACTEEKQNNLMNGMRDKQKINLNEFFVKCYLKATK